MLGLMWWRRSEDVRAGAYRVLADSWRPADEFCPPNVRVYPHQWLWDSCFHAIAWSALGDERGVRELTSCFKAQLPSGFVSHMRYLTPNRVRGPLTDRSSYTQPPIYAHAAHLLTSAGFPLDDALIAAIDQGLEWLWSHRMSEQGLLFVVHPWESGCDDSPRWDSWVGRTSYRRRSYGRYDAEVVQQTVFDGEGAAVWSSSFVAAPAAFNAFAAHAARELVAIGGDQRWIARADALASAIDEHLWDDGQGVWVDQALVGGGPSTHVPTLDGIFGALVTAAEERADRALSQLLDPERFNAPFGLRYLPRQHPGYRANAYWRGPAWPQLSYMAYETAQRWRRTDVADAIATMTIRGAMRARFAEYWNAETGRGLGARPQGWTALAAVFADAGA